MACAVPQRGIYESNYIVNSSDTNIIIKNASTAAYIQTLDPSGPTLEVSDKITSVDGSPEYHTDTWYDVEFLSGPVVKMTFNQYIYARPALGGWGLHRPGDIGAGWKCGTLRKSTNILSEEDITDVSIDNSTNGNAWHLICQNNALYFVTEGSGDDYFMAVASCQDML
jgi:hypothetical protein